MLRVSGNHRYLVHEDGRPFFWLGDTAWELFHRLTREEIDFYLKNRAEKRFTVIQAVILAEFGGLDIPNAYGHLPLFGANPETPNEAYFELIDWTLQRAAELNLHIGLLPTWGNKVTAAAWETEPWIIFNESNARAYGRYLGERYRNHSNIVWILGGDRSPTGVETVWRAMAHGIKEAGSRHLMTYHPAGVGTSSELHCEPWLDFNMIQSGHHVRDYPNYKNVAHDYVLTPTKPVIDGEPRYEDHPVDWKPEQNGYFDAYDVRQAAYWAMLAGACGHTYGCHSIWQFLTPEREPIGFARGDWRAALDFPGAQHMRHLRELFEPHLGTLRPHRSILDPNNETGFIAAAKSRNVIFLYLSNGEPVRAPGLHGAEGSWFDPRTGAMQPASSRINVWRPPAPHQRCNDWVLILKTK